MKGSKTVQKWGDFFFISVLTKYLSDCDSVLDLGCGQNSLLKYIRKHFYSEGIDIYKPSIEKSRKRKIHDAYRIGDILKLNEHYGLKSFDVVIALDVIEHLEKKDGFLLIEKMEQVALKKVVILTPNGYHLDMIRTDDLDNPYQKHKSGWTKKDLEDLGYRVYGLRGLKHIRDENATIKLKPYLFWAILSFFSEPLLYFLPELSYDLFAIKVVS